MGFLAGVSFAGLLGLSTLGAPGTSDDTVFDGMTATQLAETLTGLGYDPQVTDPGTEFECIELFNDDFYIQGFCYANEETGLLESVMFRHTFQGRAQGDLEMANNRNAAARWARYFTFDDDLIIEWDLHLHGVTAETIKFVAAEFLQQIEWEEGRL